MSVRGMGWLGSRYHLDHNNLVRADSALCRAVSTTLGWTFLKSNRKVVDFKKAELQIQYNMREASTTRGLVGVPVPPALQ